MSYASVIVEGGLFPADLLEGVATGDVPGQRPADFGDAAGRLTDAIQSAFADARAHYDSWQRRRATSTLSDTRLTREDWAAKLAELLGYGTLNRQTAALEAGGRNYPIYATAGTASDAPPVHIVGRNQALDRREGNRRSPHALVQEYLNNSEALWGMVSNGDKLRLLRDSARFSRPTYLEFDLAGIIEGNQYAEFALLYRLLHRSRLPGDGDPPNRCLLEQYYQQGLDRHGRVRENLRDGVEQALLVLGNGFLRHPGSAALRGRLADTAGGGAAGLTAEGYYRQLLRLVYRLLFLMTAEERGMLSPGPDGGGGELYAIYDSHYSVSRLRRRAEGPLGDAGGPSDLWPGLLQTFAIFGDDGKAKLLGLKALDGELFDAGGCRDLESAGCSNYALLRAMLNLSTFWDGGDDGGGRGNRRPRRRGVRRRVNYAGIDVEEFGSVYESLLDFHPRVTPGPRPEFSFAAGSERRQTGSYYTPPELVKHLVDSALEPVMEERLAGAGDKEAKAEALLGIKVCDPAAGSGHFLLAAARRIARRVAQIQSGEEEPAPAAYRAALREVIRNCIYAVDKNPLAVDLCKVALWIEGHEPGLPLSFLDHRVKCGDSLVGVASWQALEAGIPNDAYKVIAGDDRAAAAEYRKRNRDELRGKIQLRLGDDAAASGIADASQELAGRPENSVREVQAKAARYDEMRAPGQSDWWARKVACDLWTAAFFVPKGRPEEGRPEGVPTTGVLRRHLESNSAHPQLVGNAVQVSADNRFFHWPLEFAEIFGPGGPGGFDVVLGNPPWEVLQPEELKFFTIHGSDIATMAGQRRKRAISDLPQRNPELARLWDNHCRGVAAIAGFIRGSGRFPLSAKGKINTYAVFAELAHRLLNPIGRAGVIIPTGIATDHNTKDFFSNLVHSHALVSLYDFENREKVFPGIDSRIKFCLLTISGAGRIQEASQFAFFLHQAGQIGEESRRIELSIDDFRLFNPNTYTCPIFRAQRDMEIARKMYQRAGILWREAQNGAPELNPWGVDLSTMFNMTTDSGWFRTREGLEGDGWRLEGNDFVREAERYVPLYEAKLFHQYDHRFATFEGAAEEAIGRGKARNLTEEEKADPRTVVVPRYWVPEKEVLKRLDINEETDYAGTATAYGLRPTAYGLRPTAYGLRPTAYGLRPTASAITSRSDSSPERPTAGRSSARRRQSEGWATQPQSSVSALDVEHTVNYQRDQPAYPDSSAFADAGTRAQSRGSISGRWLVPFRKTTNATNQRTGIIAFTPVTGMSDRAPMLHFKDANTAMLMVSVFNSFALDFAARTAVGGTDLSYFIIKQLPIPEPAAFLAKLHAGESYAEFILPRVLELSYTAWDLRPLAEDLGYSGIGPYRWDEGRRFLIRCELEAAFFHLYGLDRDETGYIMDSFPGVRHDDIQRHGEYRTRRVILEIYDAMAAARTSGRPYATRLYPPPADPGAAHSVAPAS